MMRRFGQVSSKRLASFLVPAVRWQSEAAEETQAESKGDEASAQKKDATQEKYEELKKVLAESTSSIEKMKEEILYSAAAAKNARRQAEEDADAAKTVAVSEMAKDVLEFVDALENVCATIEVYRMEVPDLDPKVLSLTSGVELSRKVVESVLARNGVTRVNVEVGSKFDPDVAVSLFTSPSTAKIKSGHVTDVVKPGYERKGTILRRAEVGVAEDGEAAK